MNNFRQRADFIWEIANLLRGYYKQSEYGRVILPLTVLRRLDQLLAPTKKKVLTTYEKHKAKKGEVLEQLLNNAAGYKFHNRSKFDFETLIKDPNHLAPNFRNYLKGFSAHVQDIIENFRFDEQLVRLEEADLLLLVTQRFADPKTDFSDLEPNEMGYVFEELIRKFADMSNETAGEHFTPREVIELMVNMLFMEDREALCKEGIVRTLYDPACGTGGMLSIGEIHVKNMNPNSKVEVFGQEINPESYAICKAEMLIKGQNPVNIKFGNTFTTDGLEKEKFDYMLCNPPFGVEWKKEERFIRDEYDKRGFNGRFGPGLPRINDGSLLFLMHMISKMKRESNGTRLGIIFNGSPLFNGSAGSGESDVRKWIIENDMLEAIIALPDQLFYNTGISTYIWILTDRKAKRRKGKVQLVNAVTFFKDEPRSRGNKRKYIADEQRDEVTRMYGDFKENKYCKIFNNAEFGYSRITVERPKKDEQGNVVKDKKENIIPDADLRDFENVPLKEDVETYFKHEVLPHVPDAWIDASKTKIGYEISFTKYFYEYKPMRSLEEIRKDILALEKETEGLIEEVVK